MKDEILLAAATRTIIDGIHSASHSRIEKISATYEWKKIKEDERIRVELVPSIIISMKLKED